MISRTIKTPKVLYWIILWLITMTDYMLLVTQPAMKSTLGYLYSLGYNGQYNYEYNKNDRNNNNWKRRFMTSSVFVIGQIKGNSLFWNKNEYNGTRKSVH